MDIGQSVRLVEQKIKTAQTASQYAAKEVMLLVVTKTQSVERISQVMDAGQINLGENRVQELLDKYDQLPDAKWHLIGHLQTNKVKYLMGKVQMIHSLDSIELADEIQKRAANAGLVMPVLVQVNIAEEESKFGMKEEDVEDFLITVAKYPNLKVKGLMTIGPYLDDAEEIRPVFRSLRLLADKMRVLNIPNIEMEHLSMGMSNDYEVAVQEGATIVRVGSSIFGPRL